MFFISLVAKVVSFVSGVFGFGAGVTWPGEISLKLNDKLIGNLSRQLKKGVVIIAGTNGKTTTASMIEHLLSGNGAKVIHNASGANLRNGIAGTLLLATNFFGKIEADYAIFEVDEASLPLILQEITPRIVVLLNLFRDQLDRYGEVDSIALKWSEALRDLGGSCRFGFAPASARALALQPGAQLRAVGGAPASRHPLQQPPILVANADDPLIAYIGKNYQGKVYYFGLNDKKYDLGNLPHATDSTYCLNCGAKLKYHSVFLSHYGDWECLKCAFKRPKLNLQDVSSPLLGVYNLYNSLAAVLTVNLLGFPQKKVFDNLKSFKPAFGRQEAFAKNGKTLQIFLSKNPAGFNESIRTVMQSKRLSTVMFVLNDRIPDGTDVSWIWDVDFEKIVQQADNIICSGDRVYDMALRIKYANGILNKKLIIESNLEKALERGLMGTKQGGTLYILPTYSAMLDIRKILTGRKIL